MTRPTTTFGERPARVGHDRDPLAEGASAAETPRPVPASRVGRFDPDPVAIAAMAHELRAGRQRLGLSAAVLSARIRAAGGTLTAGGITSAEAGRYSPREATLRPWLVALGLEVVPFLERHRAAIAPDGPLGTAAPRPPLPRAADLASRIDWYAIDGPGPHPADESLGADLWRRRMALGLTRPELASRLCVSRWTIWSRERALRPVSPRLLARWTALLADLDMEARASGRKVADAPPDPAPPGAPGHAPTVDPQPRRAMHDDE